MKPVKVGMDLKEEEVAELEGKEKKEEEEEEEDDAQEEESESGDMPNEGFGGDTDKYNWVQTLDELDVRIPVPYHIKGRMLNIDVTNTHMKVSIKGEPEPLVE